MRVLVVVVGKRTEHWESFFAALCRRPNLEVMVQAADVSELASQRLRRLELDNTSFNFNLAPHHVGEELTGHMASITFGLGAWKKLRGSRPDVIHVIGEPSYLATHQAIRFRNRFHPDVPITHYAAQNIVMRLPLPFQWFERYAYRQIALAFPITPAALTVLRRKGYEGPSQVVPLGVDRGLFRPRSEPPDGPFTVGFVGRLEPHKGLAELLRAADQLDCRLLVVGDGSLTPWLEETAAKRSARLELVPWASHEELPTLFARMHALALPSVEVVQRNVLSWLPWRGIPLREQFGRVLVEAMASGVPLVTSTVGEMPHVVGAAGLTVPQRDPDALARALGRIRDDPGLAAELARAGLVRASRFDWNRIAGEMCDGWSRVTENGNALKLGGRKADPERSPSNKLGRKGSRAA